MPTGKFHWQQWSMYCHAIPVTNTIYIHIHVWISQMANLTLISRYVMLDTFCPTFCSNQETRSRELICQSEGNYHSNHILQPPNYLIIVVNRFRYINNQFAKDKCSIPMDMTVVLGYHKFSLQATIDHHGPSIYSGHYTTSVNCCNRTFYCNDNKITEFDMINTKNSSTAYVVIYKLIT